MPDATITISQTSAELLSELRDGLRREHGDERTAAQLVDDAIRRVHRGFFGLPPGDPDGPELPTGPFRKWASDRRAEVLLRQVDATTFCLVQPIRYVDGARRFEVPEDNVTDLASVPRVLTWLVPRYGRHTLAALVHDHLQDDTTVSPEEADVIFRDSMGKTGVPLARRWLMWAAVALRTEWKAGGVRAVRTALWAAVFGLVGLLLWPVVWYRAAVDGWDAAGFVAVAVAGCLVVPVALCWLWGTRWRWRLGAIAGVALSLFTIELFFVAFVLVVYVGIEWVIERLAVWGAPRNPVLARNLKEAPSSGPAR